jgi:hypothetical protein
MEKGIQQEGRIFLAFEYDLEMIHYSCVSWAMKNWIIHCCADLRKLQ